VTCAQWLRRLHYADRHDNNCACERGAKRCVTKVAQLLQGKSVVSSRPTHCTLVWVAAVRRLSASNGDAGDFRAWLFTVARRRITDLYRQQGRRAEIDLFETAAEEQVMPDVADAAIGRLSAQQAIKLLTKEVSGDQAEVILLRVSTSRALVNRVPRSRPERHRSFHSTIHACRRPPPIRQPCNAEPRSKRCSISAAIQLR
jgi:hypothetical protein